MANKVVIAGAGLGGLSCAYELVSNGFDVTILEARDEPGGRTRSRHDIFDGQVLELGAEYIGANHPHWQRYADEFGIALVKHESSHETSVEAGTEPDVDSLHAEYADLQSQISRLAEAVDCERPWKSDNAVQLDNTSLEEGIRSLSGSDRAKELMLLHFHLNEAAPPRLVSWLGILAIVKGHGPSEYWTDTELFRCRDGVQRLATELAARLPDGCLRLGMRVEEVVIEDDSVRVQTSSEGLTADWFVLATPASQWSGMRISGIPSLPEIRLGPATKEFVCLSQPAWDENESPDALYESPAGYLSTTVRTDGAKSACLSWFVAGDPAESRARMTDDERQRHWKRMLAKQFPRCEPDWIGWYGQDWIREPGFKGAYSYAALGRLTTAGQLLHEGSGRLKIAGECASFQFTGYMEGALESGNRAARQIAVASASPGCQEGTGTGQPPARDICSTNTPAQGSIE
jgi:monoamine oxidase